ncbi:MAG: TonB family protein [Verrucomicrobiota bacterium]|jgi:TonB family protein
MNAPGTESGVWTRGRVLSVAVGLFVLQVALILVFADRAARPAASAPPPIRFVALGAPVREDQLSRRFFAGDPAVFQWPGVHGFSGRAWFSQQPAQYRPTNRLEPPSWLDLDVSRLGTISPVGPLSATPPPLDLAGQGAAPLEPLPVFLPPEMIQTQSVFRLQGEARQRWTGETPLLPAWPSPQLLTNSVVEIGVSPAGDVLAHRLLARSGSPAADASALAAARALRFVPSNRAGTVWGQAVFEWHTSEATNGAAPK